MANTTNTICVLSVLLCTLSACTPAVDVTTMEPIHYVPIGDSYTEGDGVKPTDAWPVLLTEHLQTEKIPITLARNIAKSGWTTADALQGQLPLFKELQPNFATIFIGANDVFRGVPVEQFAAEYTELVVEVLNVLPNSNRLVLITIPDFSLTPTGIAYGRGKNISANLDAFNEIIEATGKQYNVPVANVYSTSKKFIFDVGLVSGDGLHPSRRGHELWESIIYPVVHKALLQ